MSISVTEAVSRNRIIGYVLVTADERSHGDD